MYRVLLVDDEFYVRAMLRRCIRWEDYGFTVVGEAENGEDALEQIVKCVPDLVIADIEMPFIDGLELAERISLHYGNAVRVAFLTCHDRFDYARTALKYGAEDYLLKPIAPQELVQMLGGIRRRLDAGRDSVAQSVYNVSALTLLREELLKCLRSGDYDCINSYLNDKFGRASDQRLICSREAVEQIFLNVLEEFCAEEDIPFDLPREKLEQEELIQLFLDKACGLAGNRENRQEDLVNRVRDYISAHFEDPELSLSIIARQVYVNPSYLSRVYNQVTGESITTFIRNLRLAQAMKLLRDGIVNIEFIAEKVGFRNASYFSRCFKEKYGISPSDAGR